MGVTKNLNRKNGNYSGIFVLVFMTFRKLSEAQVYMHKPKEIFTISSFARHSTSS